MKNFVDEFKAFAMKGNVVDLAVAVVIGGAFGTIVKSLVDDIIMPLVGMVTGGVDFAHLAWTLKEATDTAEAVTVNYGVFINNIITFLIIALSIFMVIKAMNKLQKEEEEAPGEEPKPSAEETILTEIRDLLKK
jgi:large conductance mechanosensitive channel